MVFKKVAVIGTGLIGGSVALAIKKQKLAREVVGVCRHLESIRLAKQARAIDRGSLDISIVKDADLVIFATPVEEILSLASVVRRLVKKDCLVTDVGSTKEKIVRKLEKIFPRFVGAHPLAGSEKRGIAFACADIFKGALCILTPTGATDPVTCKKISQLWRQLGAKVVFLSPLQHDKIIAFISHLPHFAAFSLIETVPSKFFRFASTGLKDTTRIAASDSRLWADIFLSNPHCLEAVKSYQYNLTRLKNMLQVKDRAGLIRFLKAAKKKRVAL